MRQVVDLNFDLMRRQLSVQHTLPTTDSIVAAVATLDMVAEPVISGAPSESQLVTPEEAREPWWPLIIAGVLALASETAEWFELLTPTSSES